MPPSLGPRNPRTQGFFLGWALPKHREAAPVSLPSLLLPLRAWPRDTKPVCPSRWEEGTFFSLCSFCADSSFYSHPAVRLQLNMSQGGAGVQGVSPESWVARPEPGDMWALVREAPPRPLGSPREMRLPISCPKPGSLG